MLYFYNSNLSDSIFRNNGTHGMHLHYTERSTVSGNRFEGNVTSGIILDRADDINIIGNIVNSNNRGVYIDSSNNRIGVSDNTVNNNAAEGIYARISNNDITINGNNLNANGGTGVSITSGNSGSTVSGNTVISSGGHGIYLDRATSRSSITGNIVRSSVGYGIRLDGYLTDVSSYGTVSGNHLRDNAGGGIYLQARNIAVTGNQIHNSGGAEHNNAIYVTRGTNISIVGNNISDASCTSTCYAIWISHSATLNTYIANNLFDSGSILDTAPNTIYANQALGPNGTNVINRTANSTTAFQIQNASGTALLSADTSLMRIGIGTATPAYALDIVTTDDIAARFSGRVIGADALNNNEFITLGQANNMLGSAFVQGGNSFNETAVLGTTDDQSVSFITNDIERMRITNQGSVGIGTVNPQSTLDVSSNTTTGIGTNISADNLTTGSALTVSSSSGNLSTGNVLNVVSDGEFASGNITGNTFKVDRNVVSNDPSVPMVMFDSNTNHTAASNTFHTFQHNVGANPSRLLVVAVGARGGSSPAAPTSVTYGGNNLSLAGYACWNVFSQRCTSLWYLVAPDIGTAAVELNLPYSGSVTVSAANYYNVDQLNPVDNYTDGLGTNPSYIDIPSNGQSMVMDVGIFYNSLDSTVGSGQTKIVDIYTGSNLDARFMASYKRGEVPSAEMRMGNGSSGTGYYVHSAMNINAASSGGLSLVGSAASISSTCTPGTGVCNDQSSVLEILQNTINATGDALYVNNAGEGRIAYFKSTNASSDGVTIELQSSSSAQSAFAVNTNSGTNTVLDIRADGSTIFRNSTDSTTAFQIQNSTSGVLFNANTTDDRLEVTNVVVAAEKSIRLTGGATATRPASPSEGTVYFDTTTKQLLTFANGKWQADRTTATKIVAANNSTQAAKDSADFIATGTGDQTVINSALAALPSGAGVVYLLAGTYNVTGNISISSGKTLTGSGTGTIIRASNSIPITTLVSANSGQTVTISNLRLDGNRANQFTTIRGISTGGSAGYSVIDNVTVENFNNYGVDLNSPDTRISNSVFKNNDTAIAMASSSTGSIISNNIITTDTGSVWGSIYMASVAAVSVTDNTIRSNTAPGIRVDTSTRVNITGNIIDGNTGNGITAGISQGVISGNVISNNTAHGISVTGSETTVSSNKIHNNGGTGGSHGIIVSGSRNTVSGNDITDTAGTGNAINISSGTANLLSNNRYSGTGASSIADSGTGTIYSGQIGNNGAIVNRQANSTTAFQIQNATGQGVLTANTSSGSILLGQSNSLNGQLTFANSTNANTVSITSGVTSTSYSLALPTATSGVAGRCLYDVDGNGVLGWKDCDGGVTSVTSDTNVLGSISGSNLTLGWDGQLGVARGGTGQSSFTGGHILFGQGTGAINSSSNLFWNNTSGRLGLNTDNPEAILHVVGSGGVGRSVYIDNRELKFRGDGVANMSIFGPDTGRQRLSISRSSSNSIPGVEDEEILVVASFGRVGVLTNSPTHTLDVNGLARIRTYGTATATTVCRSTTGDDGVLSVCSSNERYKDDIRDLNIGGLDTIRNLQARQFNWKADGRADLGFIAEEVAAVNPVLAQYEADGRLSGVKYTQMTALLLQGIQQLDTRTVHQGSIINALQRQVATLNRQTNNLQNTKTDKATTSALTTRVSSAEATLGDIVVASSKYLQNGQSASFSSLNVSGSTTLSSLKVVGNTTLQGSLQVSGVVSASRIVVDGNIIVGGSIVTRGQAPDIELVENIGDEAEATVEGTNSAGTISFTASGEVILAGELLDIIFSKEVKDGRVVLTAQNKEAAKLRVFVEKTDKGFKLVSFDKPDPDVEYKFDYIVISAVQLTNQN
jgi:parallel beta-helix repeat protein